MHTLVVTNSSLIRLKLCSTIGKHACYWQPSQLPRDSEVTDLGEEPNTTTLLNQHNPQQQSINICPYSPR